MNAKKSVWKFGVLGLALTGILGLQACSISGLRTGDHIERWNLEDTVNVENIRPGQQATVGAAVTICGPDGQKRQGVVGQDVAAAVVAVFYRDPVPTSRQGNPLNIYINGHYQASLIGNTFTEQQIRAGDHRLMVAFNDVDRSYVSKDAGQMFKVGQEGVQYFRINTAADVPRIEMVDQATGKQALQGRNRQDHTVPRTPRTQGAGACD